MSAGRLLVIGGDAAGMTAAAHVCRAAPETEIVVIERGPFTSYSMCGIPYYVGGEVERAEDLVVRTPDDFAELGITVHTGTEALEIDAGARRVTVADLRTGEERMEPYDQLLYATGAHPVAPPIPGLAEHSLVVHTLDEGQRLRERLDRQPPLESVVVVGGGYIGMELAEALARRGVTTGLIERTGQVMSVLDPELAEPVHDALRTHGVALHLGETLEAVEGNDGSCRRVVTDAGSHEADLVVVALGSKPNVEVAVTAGCAIGETGAVSVDPAMRTSVAGIWAAGDCVESLHLVTGGRVNVQLGTHANKQGKIAGLNLAAVAGGRVPEAAFPGVVGTAVTKVCDVEIARTGVSSAEAREVGLRFKAVTFEGSTRAGYMPDAGTVLVRMLAEEGSGRLLGAQLVGTGNVGKRIDTAATWCQARVPVQEAQLFDLAYAPPFGGVWDLLQVGARKLTSSLGLHPQL